MTPKIGTVVTLSESEQEVCRLVAAMRSGNNRSEGVKDGRKDESQTSLEIDLNGLGAEMAFCRLHNLYPDLSVSPRSATMADDQGDARLPSGERVDIKQTKYRTGKLFCSPWKRDSADVYALMIGEFPTFTYKGCITAEDLFREQNLTSLGGGPSVYAVNQSQLKEIQL